MFSISMIPYANMAPYRALGPPAGCRFVIHHPRQSVAALLRGQTLAACVPVGALPELGHLVRSLGPYGIAAQGKVNSVLLFSDRPFNEMNDQTQLFLTDHSVSSVRLLFLLLGQRVGFDHLPRLTDQAAQANGELVIGNAALARASASSGSDNLNVVTDLAEAWVHKTGLPFVFARWVVRNDAPAKCVDAVKTWLHRFQREEDALVQRSIPLAAEEFGFDPDLMADYFACIDRVLDTRHLRGQTLFLNQLSAYLCHPLFESRVEAVS